MNQTRQGPNFIFVDMSFPIHGIDHSHSHETQAPQTTAIGQNVRTFEPLSRRGRGGQRPGLIRFVDQPLPQLFVSGQRLIQNLNFVVRQDYEHLLDDADSGTVAGDSLLAPIDDISSPGVYYGPPTDQDFPGTGDQPDTPQDQERRRRGGTGGDITPLFIYPPIFDPFGKRRGRPMHIRANGWGVQPNRNSRRTVTLSWIPGPPLCYGQPLTKGKELAAQAFDSITGALVTGTYVYNPPEGTVLPIGTVTLTVVFIPDNVARYGSRATASVQQSIIDCGQGTPPPNNPPGDPIVACEKVEANGSDLGFD